MARKLRTLLLALAGVSVVAMLAACFFSAGPAHPPLPSPNGYDDFLKASGLVISETIDSSTLDRDNLRAWVGMNSEPLRLLRLGLTHQCAPPPPLVDFSWISFGTLDHEMASMKLLAGLLEAEGRLWEMDNRLADAAQSYIDAVHFGNEISRDVLLVNWIWGMSIEVRGDTPLSKLVPRLNNKEARLVVTELEKIDGARVTWDEVRRNEHRFNTWRFSELYHPIQVVRRVWQNRLFAQEVGLMYKEQVARLPLLMAELALRRFQAERASCLHYMARSRRQGCAPCTRRLHLDRVRSAIGWHFGITLGLCMSG